MQQKEWYEEWFDSEYYHILYQHRDDSDAQLLIDNLYDYLGLKNDDFVADIACGKGRHAILLNQKNLRVIGTDLSENSIAFAKQFSNKTLQFEVNDMRNPLPYQFDVLFNLFTSFGYFNCHNENLSVLHSFKKMLKPEGYFVIDFFNANKVASSLIQNESITLQNIQFNLTRNIRNECIVKEIDFCVNDKNHHYEERVQLLTLQNFEQLFEWASMEIKAVFGNYELEPFDEYLSDRLILIGKHKIQKQ